MNFSYHINPAGTRADVTVLKLNGRLMDKSEASALLNEVEELVSDGARNLLIDLSKLDYMNSSGLNVLVSILTKARNEGGEVVIANVSAKMNELFIITKLNTVFTVVEDMESGLAQLTSAEA